MVEGGSRKYESVNQGHRHAHVEPVAQRAQHAAGGGTVQKDFIAEPCVAGGDDVWLPVDGEPDVADKTLVEDRVHLGLIVNGPFREPVHAGAFGGSKSVHGSSKLRPESG